MRQQDVYAEYVNRKVYHKAQRLEYDANASFLNPREVSGHRSRSARRGVGTKVADRVTIGKKKRWRTDFRH